ncbi:PREDICTED: uncharacterized protein LOC104803142 [Tarenaya hassleriana]|uniref:uncharacterized protein LOC104803142 n=1 Tax=Tarenaya hassleriana TaxID=28532 RepID=UPI00053C5A19|nr:PREDICTED: uncharacterized protein LOC104803142 [Tarenaya hassleriana]
MLVADMRCLRCFYTKTHFLVSHSSPTPPIFSSPATLRRFSARVWSIYDPVSGQTINQVSAGGPTSSDSETGVYDTTYGRPKIENLSNGDKTQNPTGKADDVSKEKPILGTKKAASNAGSVRGWDPGDIVVSKKKGKAKTVWVCENCGHSDGQWWGSCRACNRVGTIRRFSESSESGGKADKVGGLGVSGNGVRSWLPQQAGGVQPLRLTDVVHGISQQDWRIPLPGLFGNEVARVLGGGLAPGSLILIGGDPGIGKSTLLLQMASIISEGTDLTASASVLYVSAEESVEQIGNRADRMRIQTDELFLYSSSDLEDILGKARQLSPRALIIDSIQTVYLKDTTGSAGGFSQVKECTSTLLRFAKKTNIPVLLVGHVTKAGDIAGPRVLEHIVDVVLYMEGEEHSSYRLLRSVKNRFGSTDELGVFEMSQLGLQVVSNPSGMFLSQQNPDSEVLAGLAVAVVMDGSRSFLIEIQALCVSGSTVMRHVNGIQASRADMIISVLLKQAGLKIQENAIFLNVVSGMALTETAGDLAIAAAICSSFLEMPIPYGVAFIGEIGLGGEVRTVPRMEKRVSTVAKLGYKKCVVPKSVEKSLEGLGLEETEIIGCKNLKEVINAVFRTP